MDPNMTLNLIRQMIKEADYKNRSKKSRRLARKYALSYFKDLDKLLSNGGFVPKDWNHNAPDQP